MKIELLVTVKTYPLPSTDPNIREHVCTAGVTRDGRFVRLYPIDYRYRPYNQWFSKYEILSVEVIKARKGDVRPESFTPVINQPIESIGKIDTKHNWRERKKWVLAAGVDSMCELLELTQSQKSLAIVRPHTVDDFTIEPAAREWKKDWKELFQQELLFESKQRPLEKIPYKFSYRFKCSPVCKGHKMMIEDWEVCQLFRAMRDKYQSEEIAVQKVKQKFLDTICAPNIDTHFYVGTVLRHGTWVILGVFWPKVEN